MSTPITETSEASAHKEAQPDELFALVEKNAKTKIITLASGATCAALSVILFLINVSSVNQPDNRALAINVILLFIVAWFFGIGMIVGAIANYKQRKQIAKLKG
jgi:hypothetical protein